MKRAFDFFIALLALIIFAPLFLIISFLILINLGWPVIFSQIRPGRNGKLFRMYKFRTMSDKRDTNGELLPDSERLSFFGKILRSSSLDELPGLFNVLAGDMSLVGPRPLLAEYLPLYNEEQARRHEVRPGITGWAQVNGRNAISWEEKFHLDIWYVDNQSFYLDLRILLLTLKKVVIREGINAKGEATMSMFKGNDNK